MEGLNPAGYAALMDVIKRFRRGETRTNEVKPVAPGLFELRARALNNQFRVIYMRWRDGYVGLTAFAKNQQTTPKPDLDRAKKRAGHWKRTFGD